MRSLSLVLVFVLIGACQCGPGTENEDSGVVDAGADDAGEVDAGQLDAGQLDAGQLDAGALDAGQLDAGELDAGAPDAGRPDAGALDSGSPDSGAWPMFDGGPYALAAGYDHTCVYAPGGAAKCWGDNSAMQLGPEDSGSQWPVATSPPGLTGGVASISGGGAYTCMVTAAGGAKCWGLNNDGQLGDGTQMLRASPTDVVGLTSGVASIAAGTTHTCALTTGGGVKCWGLNLAGEVGNGSTNETVLAPVDVVGLGAGVRAIGVGADHSCALLNSGVVKCWGQNYNSQLGNGTVHGVAITPSDVALDAGAIALSAGNAHNCVITTAGEARCWGYNWYGQVGDGTMMTYEQMWPTPVVGLSSGVVAISAGGTSTCALLASGALKCWGENGDGQVGNGATSFSEPNPVGVVGLSSGVTAIGTGWQHACAVHASGVRCWGKNDAFQLGTGVNGADQSTPVDVSNFP